MAPIPFTRRRTTALTVLALSASLAACSAGGSGTVTSAPAATATSPTASAIGQADVRATENPTVGGGAGTADDGALECDQVLSLSDLGAVSGSDGWSLSYDDDDDVETDLACQYDLGEMASPGWQHLDVTLWNGRQAESFLTGGLPGDPVALGDGAAWSDIGDRLLIQLGDRVLGIDVGSYLGDLKGRAGAEALAAFLLPRLSD